MRVRAVRHLFCHTTYVQSPGLDTSDSKLSVARKVFVHQWEAVVVYAATAGVVWLGVFFGAEFVVSEDQPSLLARFSQFDADHYIRIAEQSYDYTPIGRSGVAFFPMFPLLGAAVSKCFGLPAVAALLAVSNLAFLAALGAFAAYLRLRPRFSVDVSARDAAIHARSYALALMALVPTSFFFRMAYAESLFVLLSILCLLAIERRSPLILIALIAGLATATRPVGVALVPPVMVAAWCRHQRGWPRYFATLGYGILSCWGLGLYMVYLWHSFGEPLAFALTQTHWRARPVVGLVDKSVSLLLFEPIWSGFDPSSQFYCRLRNWSSNPFFDMCILNPVLFVATAATIFAGAYRRLLTQSEVLLALGLLLIPYVTRAHENAMNSHARFALVVFPAFIVWGHVLSRLPLAIVAPLFGLMGFLLGCYTALHTAGYLFF